MKTERKSCMGAASAITPASPMAMIIVIVMIMVMVAPTILAGCGSATMGETSQENEYHLYFLAPADETHGGDRIVECLETLDLPVNATTLEQAQAVVERLLEGSAGGKMESPLPEGVELLGLEIRDRRAYVDFSGGLIQMEGVDLSMADYCLTLSLTALEGIYAVSVTAQGREIGQQPKHVFYERDVLLSTMEDVLQTAEATLYFLDAENALIGENRTIELYEGQTLAENLVAALLAGPKSKDLHSALPEDFAVISVRVEDNICYLNLSPAALDLLPPDAEAQRLALWSLADSLYSMDSVQELHLLAGGVDLEYFGSIPVEIVAFRPMG